jgi:DNA-binding NtrC family response regulator
MQVSLLRFLDRGEYRPFGSTRTLQANVRVVGATNQDIQELVHQGRFRDDLLYRINAITLRMPPLHERKEDLSKPAEHILSTLRIPGATNEPAHLMPCRRLPPTAGSATCVNCAMFLRELC